MSSNQYDYNFFDRNGKAITLKEWCKESSGKHVFQKETIVNGLRILTKWTGVDMPEYEWLVERQFSMKTWTPNYKPQIFVSYVWNEDHILLKSKRYPKIELAYAGHADLIEQAKEMDFGVYYSPIEDLEEIHG